MRTQDLVVLRNQFIILSVDRDEETAEHLASEVRSFGYTEAVSCAAAGSVSRAMSEPPHVLLVDCDAPTELDDYLTVMQDASPETLIILLIRAEQSLRAFQLIEKGLAYDSVVRPFVSALELSQKIDRACSELYHLFEAEQLREHVVAKRPNTAKESSLLPEIGEAGGQTFLNDYLERLEATKDLDETTLIFIETLFEEWDVPVLYFKYLPSQASLPLAMAAGQKVEKYRGFGIDLRRESPEQMIEFFRAPENSALLKRFIKDVFGVEKATSFTHTTEGEARGLFVALTARPKDIWSKASRALALKRIFDVTYKKNLILKEKHALDVVDAVTGLLNRRHFTQKIDDEISRARRILMPLSLMTIDVDHFQEVNQKIGFQQADAVLKVLATIMKKTTRANDLIARMGPDEFMILMPHTGQTGASIKAERLRRLIESTKFPRLGTGAGQVTVSMGVSEFPSLSQDGESLMRSADEALSQARETGNKVCLSTVSPEFKMEYKPNEVRSSEVSTLRKK